jgi:protein tyrosine/serine phosphatase
VETGDRLLPLVGAYNFRDLGGYPAAGGRRTRWGRLFRSDTLHELTPEDLVVLRELGLRTVIDLRSVDEVQQSGRGLLAHEPIDYRHLSVLADDAEGESEAGPAPAGADLADRYLWYLEVGRGALVKALGAMAEDDRYPIVFHCAAGKDRTGVLAALVLDLVGVEPAVIAQDYVITAGRLDLIVARLRRDPVHGARMDQIPPSHLAVEISTMERFVDLLHRRLGGARAWAIGAGLDVAAADRLGELLLEPEDVR